MLGMSRDPCALKDLLGECRVQGLLSPRVWHVSERGGGLEFRVWGSGSRVEGLGMRLRILWICTGYDVIMESISGTIWGFYASNKGVFERVL